MSAAGIGAFLTGLGGGYVVGQRMDADRRREQRADEAHALNKRAAEVTVRRAEAEEPLHAQEVQLRGLLLDYQTNETLFAQAQQGLDQETRRQLAQAGKTRAGMAVADTSAAARRQPTEIAIGDAESNARLGEAYQRQTANIWNTLRLGNHDIALRMLNDSNLIAPGKRFKEFRLDQSDATDAQGKAIKVPVLSLVPEGDGEPMQIPVAKLDALSAQYSARYEKVGNSLVRVNRDGTVTPLYTPDEFAANPETGGIFSKRTGQPAAAGGVNPGGAPGAPPGGRKAEAHLDDRVKQGTGLINRYFGISEFSGLDPKNQPKYTKMVAKMGAKVRMGTAPEDAAKVAIDEVNREDAAAAAGGGGGGAAYTGPAPWRK